MSKVGSLIVILFFVGFICLAIPRFIAPSDTYIQDTLEPTEEPFYFTLNPISQTVVVGSPTYLSACTNLSDVSYSWEYVNLTSLQSGESWLPTSSGVSLDGGYYIVNSGFARTIFYRCVATSGDRTIYSSPAMINLVLPSNNTSNSSFLKSDFDSDIQSDLESLEKNSELVDSENTDLESIEVITESEGE